MLFCHTIQVGAEIGKQGLCCGDVSFESCFVTDVLDSLAFTVGEELLVLTSDQIILNMFAAGLVVAVVVVDGKVPVDDFFLLEIKFELFLS